ncbi:MAG: sugar phosphate isomerase/epimerase [Phycisphaerae bacterium]|jgi:sugar phosphate isomerase/epimerase
MKLGFSSLGCPEWDLETIVAQAKSLGYDGVELRGLQGQMHLPACPALRRDPRGVASLFKDAHVELVCLGTGNSFHWTEPRRLATEKAQTREFLELAGELGCPFVRVFGDEVPRYEDKNATLLRIVAALRELAPVAAANKVTLLLENHGDFAGSRDLWFILDAVNHPAVRGCWHPCHGKAAGDRPTLAVPRLGRKIALTHVVDGKFTAQGALEVYVLPGDGDVDMGLVFDLLRGVAYDGYLMFEWPKLWVPALAGPEQALPAALSKMKALLAELEKVKELTAYKGDKNTPRYAKPAGRA